MKEAVPPIPSIMSTRQIMERTNSAAQLQGNTKTGYMTNDLRHAQMVYKRVQETARMLDTAKLNLERATGKLGIEDNKRFQNWVNQRSFR